MTYALLLGVLVVQGLVLVGWHRTLDVPGRLGGILVGGGAALAADLLVLADDGKEPLARVPAVLGLVMVAAVVHQMLRGEGRARLNVSLAGTVTGAVFASSASGYLAAEELDARGPLLAVTALAAGLCTLVPVVGARLRLPGWFELLLGPALAVPTGAAVAGLSALGPTDAVLLAVAAAAVATAAGAFVARAPAPARGVAVGLSFCAAGPLAYVLGRLLVG